MKGIGIEHAHDFFVGSDTVAVNVIAIGSQKAVANTKCGSLIAIDEWVITPQTFHKGCGFFYYTVVVSRLRTEDC
ncbi:MAG: hypothetical protein OXO50_15295 [Caldilineaceae bacterium]|nr:hypothetical protein [Caldilineaceae bacterium]